MTLTDAGPLVALIDADEPDHDVCVAALAGLSFPLVTTWPAFTEAMHLLGRIGWPAQAALWRLVKRDELAVATTDAAANNHTAGLMEKYADRPMDLADATLVSLAEAQGLSRIFTLDGDFHVYRLSDGRALEVIPA